MLLALLHAPPLPASEPSPLVEASKVSVTTGLAEGILRQQRPNGSYQIYFHDLPDQGEELYSGEAMLALVETYSQVPDPRFLHSSESGLSYYHTQYFQRGRVAEEQLIFFANWQSQTGRLLFECTPRRRRASRRWPDMFTGCMTASSARLLRERPAPAG